MYVPIPSQEVGQRALLWTSFGSTWQIFSAFQHLLLDVKPKEREMRLPFVLQLCEHSFLNPHLSSPSVLAKALLASLMS